MRPDYPHKYFHDQRYQYFLLVEFLSMNHDYLNRIAVAQECDTRNDEKHSIAD